MDLFFLKYNFREEMGKNIYTWQEILFAVENKIITEEDIIEYATYIINLDTIGYETVMEIVCLNSDENVYPYLQKLIMLEDIQDITDIKAKWLYLILKWLYEKRYNIQNVIEIVEEIYEIFGYPDIIASFVRYMPSERGDLGSLELNRKSLFENWANYLERFEEKHLKV